MEPLRNREPANGTALAECNRRGSKQRSRVTNGRLWATTIRDGRSGWSRRVQDLYSLYISHMGGEDYVTQPERTLAGVIATSIAELEWIACGFKRSKGPTPEQLDLYWRGANNLRRNLETIGLERRSRDVTPTLEDIAAEIQAEQAAAEQEDGTP